MHHGRSSMPLWMTGGDIWRPLTFSFKDRRASVARSARRARTRCAFAETAGLLSNFSFTSLQTEKQIYLKTDFQLAKRHLQAGVQFHNALGSSWECFSVPVFVDAIAVVVADALTHTFVKIIYHGLAHTCVKVVYHHHPFPMQRTVDVTLSFFLRYSLYTPLLLALHLTWPSYLEYRISWYIKGGFKLKRKCHFENILVSDCTGSCKINIVRYRQYQIFFQNDIPFQ